MDKPTREGEKRIERWKQAIDSIKRIKSELSRAECELTNATNELGRWMVPDDIQVGETMGVWHGDELISVTKTDASVKGDFKIEPRKSKRKAELQST